MVSVPSEEEGLMLMAIYAGQTLPALPGVLVRLQARGLVEMGPRGLVLTREGDKAAQLATLMAAKAEGLAAKPLAARQPTAARRGPEPSA